MNTPYGARYWLEYDRSRRTIRRWYDNDQASDKWVDATFTHHDAARTGTVTYWKLGRAKLGEFINQYDAFGQLTWR